MYSVGGKMTLIEFFDNNAIDNIISSLILRPKRVVLFGYNYDSLTAFGERMDSTFKSKNIDTQVECIEIDNGSFESIKKLFSEFVEKYGDCAFDLSGGDSLILAAIGAVSEKYSLSMHTVNSINGTINIINDSNDAYKKFHNPKLTVEDCIVINGGVSRAKNNRNIFRNSGFINDIKNMWNICNKNCAEWNKTIHNLGEVIRCYAKKQSQKKMFVAKVSDINEGFKKVNKSFYLNSNVIKRLVSGGYLTSFSNNGETLSVSFKNDLAFDILTKSGRLLELYTFMIGATIEIDGKKFFDDYQSSVIIDWEKPIRKSYLALDDVINEIDVIFTKNVTPVFVSCKNGNLVSVDELYKLFVVAERFGGENVKKVLVSTYFEPDEYFLKRAKELGITVIFNVDKMSFRKFSDKLCESVI